MKLRSVLVFGCLLGCSSEAATPEDPPDGHQLGNGGPVTFSVVYQAELSREVTAVAFNPAAPGELWALLREPYEGLPCTENVKQGCNALVGRFVLVRPDGALVLRDPNAWHFLRRPTSIAFGQGLMFATCGEYRTGNYDDGSVDYMGPTLWTSDPSILAQEQPPPPDGSFEPNGSHLDMLHETPFCMGIAYHQGNAYFTFNGKLGSIDRYDFKQPHLPGGSDHSDGELTRFVEGELLRVENAPSHMAWDAKRRRLYVADTGHGRVVALDPASGSPGGEIATNEPIARAESISGATLTELVPPGALGQPSGLVFAAGALFVGDRASGRIHAFAPDGTELASLDTGLGPGTLAGVAVGPDDRVYFADQYAGRVIRVDVP